MCIFATKSQGFLNGANIYTDGRGWLIVLRLIYCGILLRIIAQASDCYSHLYTSGEKGYIHFRAHQSINAVDAFGYTTSSDMCANTSVGFEPEGFLQSIPPLVRSFHLLSILTLTAAVLSLNGTVILVACKNRKTDPYAMTNAAALATLDIAWAAITNPIGFFAVATTKWPFGSIFCDVTGSLTLAVILLRNQLVGLAVVDKFCNVFAPFGYPSQRRRVTTTLGVAAIVFAIVYSIPPAVTRRAGRYTFYTAYAACFVDLSCYGSARCDGYLAVIGAHWIVCWAIMPAVLFTAMCVKARTATVVPVMGTFAAERTPNKKSIIDPAGCNDAPKPADLVADSERGNQNNRSDTGNGTRRSKVHATFLLHMVIYIGCFLPLAVHFITYRTGYNDEARQSDLSTTLGLICGDLGLLLAVLDPLVTLTNRNARASVLSNFWRQLLD